MLYLVNKFSDFLPENNPFTEAYKNSNNYSKTSVSETLAVDTYCLAKSFGECAGKSALNGFMWSLPVTFCYELAKLAYLVSYLADTACQGAILMGQGEVVKGLCQFAFGVIGLNLTAKVVLTLPFTCALFGVICLADDIFLNKPEPPLAQA